MKKLVKFLGRKTSYFSNERDSNMAISEKPLRSILDLTGITIRRIIEYI